MFTVTLSLLFQKLFGNDAVQKKSETISFSLLTIAPFFIWGTTAVTMRTVVLESSPFFVAGVRLLLAGLLVLLLAFILKIPQPKTLKAWLWVLCLALLQGVMLHGFLAAGFETINAGLGSVIVDSNPLFVAILSSILFREKVGLWGGIGLVIGILGISLISLPESWLFSGLSNSLPKSLNWRNLKNYGSLLMLLSTFFKALATVMIPFITRLVHPIVTTGWAFLIGGLPLLVFSGIWESQQWVHLDTLTVGYWVELIYTGLFGSAIAYAIYFYLASRESLTSFTSLSFLTPVFALTGGYIFLGETLSLWKFLGICLTLVSVYIIQKRDQLGSTSSEGDN
ncbi:MAG: DMT family transporter [Cyanobacteria bacterium P01_H01_bin.35]